MNSIFEVNIPENFSDSTTLPMDKELKVCPKCKGQIKIDYNRDKQTWSWKSMSLVPFIYYSTPNHSSWYRVDPSIDLRISRLEDKISDIDLKISTWENGTYPFECATGESFTYRCCMCGFCTRGRVQNIKMHLSLIEALQRREGQLECLKTSRKIYIEEIDNIRKTQVKALLESEPKKKKSWWG
jgi:hypothetical protein